MSSGVPAIRKLLAAAIESDDMAAALAVDRGVGRILTEEQNDLFNELVDQEALPALLDALEDKQEALRIGQKTIEALMAERDARDAEIARLRAVTVAYWARFGAVPEDGANILAARDERIRRLQADLDAAKDAIKPLDELAEGRRIEGLKMAQQIRERDAEIARLRAEVERKTKETL